MSVWQERIDAWQYRINAWHCATHTCTCSRQNPAQHLIKEIQHVHVHVCLYIKLQDVHLNWKKAFFCDKMVELLMAVVNVQYTYSKLLESTYTYSGINIPIGLGVIFAL